jgi:hemolysin activation/secretion protein
VHINISKRIAAAGIATSLLVAAQPSGRQMIDPLLYRKQGEVDAAQRQLLNERNRIPTTPLRQEPLLRSDGNVTTSCYRIDRIELEPYRLLNKKTVEAAIAPYLHRCDSVADLLNLVRRLNNLYIEGSYITSMAYLKPQDISTGTLRISIIEGKIGRVEGVGVNPKLVFSPIEGKALSLRDIESRLALLNGMRSLRATMKLLPGKEEGETDLRLIGERIGAPWHGSFGFNNFGYRPTGRLQFSGSLGFDNLLGFNDVLDLHLNTTDRTRNSLNRGFTYRFPVGKNLLSFSYTLYRYRQKVRGLITDYISEGRNKEWQLQIERELYHTLRSKGTLSFGLSHARNDNFLAGIHLSTSSSRLTVATLGYSQKFRGDMWNGYLTLSYHQGISLFKTYAPAGTKKNFSKLMVDAGYSGSFARQSDGFYLGAALTFHGQWAQMKIPGTELLSIGGPYSVRGFQEAGQLSGNTGGYLRSELSLNQPIPHGYFSPYLGLDLGHVIPNRRSVGGTIVGFSAGVRLSLGSLRLDLYGALPLRDPHLVVEAPNGDITRRRKKGRFGMSLSYLF